MSSYSGYNGWTNKATWLVSLWYGDFFNDMVVDGGHIDADYIEGFVQEMIDETVSEQHGLIMDFINMSMAEVNWRELADHYMQNAETEEEDEEVEEDA